jgi:ABC-2 type transport system ATP-binding protein
VGITEMRELIGRLAGGDRTVLVSSHLLSELEHVCDWLLIIDDGRLVYAGEREGFSGRAGHEIVLGPLDPADLLALADLVAAHGHDAGREGGRLVLTGPGDGAAPGLAAELNTAAAHAGIALAEVHVRRPTLEASYLRLLEGDVR